MTPTCRPDRQWRSPPTSRTSTLTLAAWSTNCPAMRAVRARLAGRTAPADRRRWTRCSPMRCSRCAEPATALNHSYRNAKFIDRHHGAQLARVMALMVSAGTIARGIYQTSHLRLPAQPTRRPSWRCSSFSVRVEVPGSGQTIDRGDLGCVMRVVPLPTELVGFVGDVAEVAAAAGPDAESRSSSTPRAPAVAAE